MMKWPVFILLNLLWFLPCNETFSQLKVGGFIGPNLSSIVEKHYDDTKKGPSYLGYNLGIATELIYDDKLQLDIDFYYNFKRAKEIESGGGLGGWGHREILYNFDIFSLSCLINFGITKNNNFSFVFGGVYYNIFSIKGSGYNEYAVGPNQNYIVVDDSNIQKYVGQTSGVGLQLGLEKSFHLKNFKEVNLKGIVSLAKIFSIELHIELLRFFSFKNNSSD